MFFNKNKKPSDVINTQPAVTDAMAELPEFPEIEDAVSEKNAEAQSGLAGSDYAFYKPNPYPKDLVSVIKSMLQKLFPDTRKAFLLEAQHNNKKGYLLIVDIDSKYLKIINIYLDGETKRVRGNVPIECVLYSKSGSITEGVEPFYFKETAESKANNLASSEFSGEVVFSDMPEFEIRSEKKKTITTQDIIFADKSKEDVTSEKTDEESLAAEDNVEMNKSQTSSSDDEIINEATPEESPALNDNEKTVIEPLREDVEKEQTQNPGNKPEEKSQTKVKPSTKAELFGLLNEYGAKKTGTVSTVAMAAIREFKFYIPYTSKLAEGNGEFDTSLPIDEDMRFDMVIDADDETKAVPLFTEKDDAVEYAKKEDCRVAFIKYKEFAASSAAEQTGHDGIVINPDAESIYLASDHPLLG